MKGQMKMATMTKENALHLHSILDKYIGVFRQDEMPEGAVKFHEKKRDDFVKIFTTEIPETYWFQGVKFHSVNLTWDDEHGFTLVPTVIPESHLKPLVESTNRKIREANLMLVKTA